MKYLLDSNIVIAAIDGTSVKLRQHMADADEDDLVTSSIVYAEVAFGSETGKPPLRRLLDCFVEQVPVLPFDVTAAGIYAHLPFRRASYDRLIAAHAVALGLILVTNNEGDFADVPALVVENWLM